MTHLEKNIDCTKNDVNVSQGITIVYDGECPVCHHFVTGIRLRKLSGQLHLISAREQNNIYVKSLRNLGINLNDNMVVMYGDQVIEGAAAITWLAAISSPSHFLNRVLFFCFSSPKLGAALYPLLRVARLTILFILGRSPIK